MARYLSHLILVDDGSVGESGKENGLRSVPTNTS